MTTSTKTSTPLAMTLLLALSAACSEGAALIGEVRPRPSAPPVSRPSPPDLDAGAVPDADPFAPPRFQCRTTDDIYHRILNPKCGVCHGDRTDPPAAKLLLTSGDVRQRIIDRRSTCDGRPLITFTSGQVGGHFFSKLDGAVAGCGDQMPFGGIAPLNQTEIECLRTWLQGGLPPGASPLPAAPDLDAGTNPDLRDHGPPPFPCLSSADIRDRILRPKCAVCHDQMSAPVAGNLVLTTDDVRQRIIDGRSTCDGRPFITFNNGYVGGRFFETLDGPIAGCGTQMPWGGLAPLNQGEIACLRTWIQGDLP